MVLVYITGTPGSGKTYLLNSLSSTYDTYDTDDWKDKRSDIKKHVRMIKAKDTNTHVSVIAGILDHLSPDIEQLFDYKFFMTVSTEQLYKQINTRLVHIICKTKNQIIKLIRKYDDKTLKFSHLQFKPLKQVKKEYHRDLATYKRRGYQCLSAKDIRRLIYKLNGTNNTHTTI